MKHLLENKRKIIFLSLGIVGIFATYFILAPMGDGYRSLNKGKYPFSFTSTNQETSFKRISGTHFFIQTSTESRGNLTFLQSASVQLNFSIQKNPHIDEMKISIKKNGGDIQRIVIDEKKSSQLLLKLDKGDTIEMVADKNTPPQQANLHIKVKNKKHELYICITLLLWSMFFVFFIY